MTNSSAGRTQHNPFASGRGTNAPGPRRPKRSRFWRYAWLAIGFGPLLGAGIAAGALACRPRWYAPAAVDHARLVDDKRALVGRVEDIGQALQAGRAIDVELFADQVNRWIVARRELSPEEWLDADLRDLGQFNGLVVGFLPDQRIRIAATVEAGGFQVVASAVLRVTIANETVGVRIEAVYLGRMPVPIGWVVKAARQGGASALRDDASMEVANNFVWPNGKRRFRLESVETADNRATVRVAPLRRAP